MPIAVVCGSCNSKLNAPDGAAGKSVKCPKCKAPLTVPDAAAPQFEVVDEPEPPKKKKIVVVDDDDDDDDADEKPKAKSKKKSRPVEDADDDEDEDEKPKKKKKKKKVAAVDSGNMIRNIVGIVVLVIALGFAAFVWWDRSKSKEKDEKTDAEIIFHHSFTLPAASHALGPWAIAFASQCTPVRIHLAERSEGISG